MHACSAQICTFEVHAPSFLTGNKQQYRDTDTHTCMSVTRRHTHSKYMCLILRRDASNSIQIRTLVAPWFVNFFVSWFRAESNFRKPIHWITFEEVIHQPEETIVKVLDVHEVPVDRALVSNVLFNADVVALGKNKGVQGRGRQLLSAFQVEKITQLSRFYPDIDFSLLGIK